MSEFPKEIERFFCAMRKEYLQHQGKKGDSWMAKEALVGTMYPTHSDYNEGSGIRITEPMNRYLQTLLKQAFEDYSKNKKIHQLVDISLICSMIWCRKAFLSEEKRLEP